MPTNPAQLSRVVVQQLVARALDEDLGRGDLTTDACVPQSIRGFAEVRAREPLVLSGSSVAFETFRQVDRDLITHARAADGDALPEGAVAMVVEGSAASILKAERVALNLLQRMSGVATLTRTFVDRLPVGSHTRIVDTRKTTPGLRHIERYAVRCGGGHNHRQDLGAALLIKDNHIAASGSLKEAVARARQYAPHTSRVSCEVDSLEQLAEALEAGVESVLLDNFDDARLKSAVQLIAGRALVEVSGGVTLERVSGLAAAGVDIISIGALTHSARAVDIGLDWVS